MKKSTERTSSCTAKLSVINGMYPQVSCNHTMRRGEYNVGQLAETQRKNWKLIREQQKYQKIFLKALSEAVVKLVMEKRHNDHLRAQRAEKGAVSIAEILTFQNNNVFQQLKNIK